MKEKQAIKTLEETQIAQRVKDKYLFRENDEQNEPDG